MVQAREKEGHSKLDYSLDLLLLGDDMGQTDARGLPRWRVRIFSRPIRVARHASNAERRRPRAGGASPESWSLIFDLNSNVYKGFQGQSASPCSINPLIQVLKVDYQW